MSTCKNEDEKRAFNPSKTVFPFLFRQFLPTVFPSLVNRRIVNWHGFCISEKFCLQRLSPSFHTFHSPSFVDPAKAMFFQFRSKRFAELAEYTEEFRKICTGIEVISSYNHLIINHKFTKRISLPQLLGDCPYIELTFNTITFLTLLTNEQ